MQMQILLIIALINLIIRIKSETVTIGTITLTWSNQGNLTNFVMQTVLTSLSPNNVWVGFGFNMMNQMNQANVVICKSRPSGTSIEHYYNSNYQSLPLANPTVGISNAKVQLVGNILTCSFNRDNTNSALNYFKITSQTSCFIIAAYGSFGSTEIAMHTYKSNSPGMVTFVQASASTTTTTRITTTSATTTTSSTTTKLSSTTSTTAKVTSTSATQTTTSTKVTTILTTTTTSLSSTSKQTTTTSTTTSFTTIKPTTQTTSTSSSTTTSRITIQSSTATTSTTSLSKLSTLTTLTTTSTSTKLTSISSITTTSTSATSLITTKTTITTTVTTTTTTILLNKCLSNPCFNGYCRPVSSSYVCDCFPGYTGTNCQTINQPCAINPCQNGGTCVPTGNSYQCRCLRGYSGINCQINFICNPNPCLNGGLCYQTSATEATCQCRIGYSGSVCQLNPCSVNPCRNNGICTLSGTQYKCTCQAGYTGTDCETFLNACYINNSPACLNNGVCTTNLRIFPYFTCSCKQGYSGTRCQNVDYINQFNCVDRDVFTCQFYSTNKYCSDSFYIKGVSVLKYCAKSCNSCTNTSTSPSTATCVDTNSDCSNWANLNYCSLYPVYNLCKKSCHLC